MFDLAERAYAEHVLKDGPRLDEDGDPRNGTWFIKRPDGGMYATWIVSKGPWVAIFGDGPEMILRYSELSALAGAGIGYIQRKMGANAPKMDWERDVAIEDIKSHIKDLMEEDEEEGFSVVIEDLESLIFDVRRGMDREHMQRELYDILDDSELLWFGEVPVSDLYYAQAALKRLWSLIT